MRRNKAGKQQKKKQFFSLPCENTDLSVILFAFLIKRRCSLERENVVYTTQESNPRFFHCFSFGVVYFFFLYVLQFYDVQRALHFSFSPNHLHLLHFFFFWHTQENGGLYCRPLSSLERTSNLNEGHCTGEKREKGRNRLCV